MGKPVTIDSDDVEVLLNAAAAIRHVENALEAVRQDPAMIRLYKSGKIGQALDRCNRARAQAMKDYVETPPNDWEPSDEEFEVLCRLMVAGPMGLTSDQVGQYANLRSLGVVVAGQVNEYVNWGDKTQATQSMPYQRFKLSDWGAAWMKANYQRASQSKRIGVFGTKEITHGQG